MTFKKLVTLISNIRTVDDFNRACAEVDISFQREKITWNDHECLYNILRLINLNN